MKNKLYRIISSLLVLAFIISCLSVFAFASDSGSSEGLDPKILYNRTFDEGWDYTNGLTGGNLAQTIYSIDYEENSDYSYNYFLRIETPVVNTAESVLKFDFGVDVMKESGTVVELSVKVDDVADIGNIMYANTAQSSQTNKADKISILDLSGGKLTAFSSVIFGDHTGVALGSPENEWVHFAFVLNWDGADIGITVYYDKDPVTGEYQQSAESSLAFVEGEKGLKTICIGMPATAASDTERAGMNFCIDNFKIYQNVTRLVDIEEGEYGMMVNPLAEKTIEIKKSRDDKSISQILEESLCMKVGVDYALVRNERQPITFDGINCPPVKMVDSEGKERVMIPLLEILDYIGYQYLQHPDKESFDITTGTSATYIAVGRDSATVGGERVELSVAPGYNVVGDNKYIVIALDDVESLFPGWLVTYDDMGLIVIYEDTTPDNKEDNAEIVNRDDNLSLMLSLMKKFVFQNVEAAEAVDSYNQTGAKVYSDVKKNTELKHPYLLANQSTFDALKAAFASSDKTNLKNYIGKIVSKADGYYNEYAKVEGDAYAGIKEGKAPLNPYSDGNNPIDAEDTTIADTEDGYALIGGRLDEVVKFSEVLPTLAFAYQVTGNAKYASLAYDYAAVMASWTHWGPGYFTNCAEATANFAIAYDWLYNAFVEAKGQEATDALAKAIFELGVHDGYISSLGKSCEHARVAGDESAYTTLTTNKNTVCSSSMIIGALAILDYAEKEGNEDMLAETVYLIGNNMINLANYGLDEYAPDGSYIESATYWSYATNYFTRMVMALNSAAGNDYGFLDTWGMSTTAYYAAHIENSDGFIWNYHDGGSDGYTDGDIAAMDTQSLFFLGAAYGDKAIVAHREKQLREGREPSLYELLCYPEAVNVDDAKLTLNYYMNGIEAYVSRSDWDEGARYVGLMGGRNDAYHGQIDSGNFIYQNKGITWFMDLGAENYDTYQYFGSSRYKYYRASSEGNNVVILTSNQEDVGYGQYSKAGGKIYKTFENEHGSYALLDNTDVYLDTVSYAKRGMLVTNDGNTVVIQDEIYFQLSESVTWVAHTAQKITLNEDGNIAYLTNVDENGVTTTLRAALVTRTRDVTFEILDATENLLNSTYTASDSVSYGGEAEYARDNIKKLAITQSGVLSLNVAVVFEIVESDETTEPVGYEWVTMDNWEPTAASSGNEVTNIRDSAKRNDIMTFSSAAGALLKRDNVFTEQLETLYSSLTQVAYTLETFKPENLSEQAVVNAYIDYLDYVDEYDEYKDFVNERVEASAKLAERLFGFVAAVEE